jgi:putative ABC transport system permease protein
MVPLAYSVRNLAVRRTTTAATAGGIALVVFVFATVLMLGEGMRRTLATSGSPDVAIVMRAGADSELSSIVEPINASLATGQPMIARRPGGAVDASGELVVVIALPKLGTNGVSNVLLRGVPDGAFQLHRDVKIVEGRAPRPGSDEVIVGKAIRGRFAGLDIGQTFELRKGRTAQVVGAFEANGSANESEVWGDLDAFRNAFGRGTMVSSVRVRLSSPGAFDSYKAAVESDPQLDLKAQRESEYYEKQGQTTAQFFQVLGIIIAVFFSFAAMIGAMITMYGAVANRGREIGTLRALGFSKASILSSFLIESIGLSVIGGALGVVGAMGMMFVRFSMINYANWSEMVIGFDPTVKIVITALIFSLGMGLIGGLLPAVRAARMQLLEALRA